MRKIKITVTALTALLGFQACTKQGIIPIIPSPVNISQFKFTTPWSGWDSVQITYDQWNNPISGTRPEPRTGAPNYKWRYDRNHRLTDWIGPYESPSPNAEFWHKYSYDSRGNIVTDSNFSMLTLSNGQISYAADTFVSHLSYDSYGRLIREDGTPGGTRVYVYDTVGNLQNGAIYDNKVNFHRTSKVWMFLDRDYSVNNPFTAGSYNRLGLPLHVGPTFTETAVLMPFIYNYYTEAWFTYAPCH
jgi:hypothetical protein